MKRFAFLLGLVSAVPLMGLDSVEVYLPTWKLIYSVDDLPTKVPVMDSTNFAYIALLKANVYPRNLVEILSFRDFPPIGWSADPEWGMKFELVGSSYVYPAVIYTYTSATGSYALMSSEIDLSLTDFPAPDTLRFTYKLTGIDNGDTIYIEVIKSGDDTTMCWTPIDRLNASNVTTSPTLREVQVLPSSYACGSLTDADVVNIRFRFKDNSSLTDDTTKFFAMYDLFVSGKWYRPSASDTIPDAMVNYFVGTVKAAFEGVPEAILNFVGMNASDLRTKNPDKKIVILIAPFNMSNVSQNQAYLGYWDLYDTLNAYDFIYINYAKQTADGTFGGTYWDTTKVRRYLAFQFARLVAYSLDTTEAYNYYPGWFNQYQIAAKAAWIAHKVLRSDFGDPLGLAAGIKGGTPQKSNVPLIGGSLSFTYDGRVYVDPQITKILPWIVHVEDLVGADAIKTALKEPDVPFFYYPFLSNSLNNLILGAGSNFYTEVENLYLKELGAGYTWDDGLSGYPHFTSDDVFNTLDFSANSSANEVNKVAFPLAAYRYSVNQPGRKYLRFDGADYNSVITYIGGNLDTIPGFVLYKVDLNNNTWERVELDSRLRWSFRDDAGLRNNYYFLLINVGATAFYSMSADFRDTLPPTVADFAIMPNASAPEFVDVYLFSDSKLYFDAGQSGVLVQFWPKNDSAKYEVYDMYLSYAGMSDTTYLVYKAQSRLSFTDLFGNEYFGPIRYRLALAQNAAGVDYVTSISDTAGEFYKVRLGTDMAEIIPGVLSMASTAGEQRFFLFPNGKEYVFNVPVHAHVKVAAEEGDRVFYFNGYEWLEATTYYYPEEGKAEAFVNGARRIYVGKEKPSTTPVSDFRIRSELGKVLVSLPEAADIVLKIYDPMGRLVKTFTHKVQKSGNYAFELSDLPKGVYLIHVRAGKFGGTAKVIVLGGAR